MLRKPVRPIKMWINGRIFTVPVPQRAPKQASEPPDYVMNEEQLEDLEIIEEMSKCSAKIQLPKWYHPRLAPISEYTINDGILVEKADRNSLGEAVGRLHAAASQLRLRSPPLQFACIPCTHPSIQKSFLNLQEQLLSMQDQIPGLDASIFMSPLKLHVTIDVYSLFDENERAEAVRALEEYHPTFEQLQRTGPLSLEIGTLECMDSNLKNVNVLYANVKFQEDSQQVSLQGVVDGIAEHFYQRGLARRDPQRVKLHMTVMNTKYRKGGKGKRRRVGVDARRIMEKFKNFQFGTCRFDAVHLSHINLRGADGFYQPLAVMRLNAAGPLV